MGSAAVPSHRSGRFLHTFADSFDADKRVSVISIRGRWGPVLDLASACAAMRTTSAGADGFGS